MHLLFHVQYFSTQRKENPDIISAIYQFINMLLQKSTNSKIQFNWFEFFRIFFIFYQKCEPIALKIG